MTAALRSTTHSRHPNERKARAELAACYRIFAMLGWTEMIYNHITVRRPDSVTQATERATQPHQQFPINPAGFAVYAATRGALQFHPDHGGGQDVFDALVRQVDRINVSYQN